MTKERGYDAEYAIHIAELWDAGKLIGADQDEVVFALLDEVKRLRVDLREVCNSWVNGRRVLDGIPKTIADRVRSAVEPSQ